MVPSGAAQVDSFSEIYRFAIIDHFFHSLITINTIL